MNVPFNVICNFLVFSHISDTKLQVFGKLVICHRFAYDYFKSNSVVYNESRS